MSTHPNKSSGRDWRLDLFRGFAMAIILIAHIPGNAWAEWVPARFGLSDATEIFVFCSGMASAHAYGAVFERSDFRAGLAKILARIRLVYVAHIAVIAAIVVTALLTEWLFDGLDILSGRLALSAFIEAPLPHTAQILTLTFVPNAFDILPMYLVVLALVPIVVALVRRNPLLAIAFSFALWFAAGLHLIEITADRATGRPWFFNPFGWQLLFFLGFGFARGWLAAPRATRVRLAGAALIVLLAAPVSCHAGWACHAGWGSAPWLGDIHRAFLPFADKSTLGPLRVLHFLALAFLATWLFGSSAALISSAPCRLLRLLGRQTLASFLAGLWLAQVLGLALDLVGRGAGATALANLLGLAALACTAFVVERLKHWKSRRRVLSRMPNFATGAIASS